jgi:hypothetical protein
MKIFVFRESIRNWPSLILAVGRCSRSVGRTSACDPARQNAARGDRHARAYRNAHVDQNKVPNNLLVNEPSLSTQGTGGSCGR